MNNSHLTPLPQSDPAQIQLLGKIIAELVLISRQVGKLKPDENVAIASQQIRAATVSLMQERTFRSDRAEMAVSQKLQRDYESRFLEEGYSDGGDEPPEIMD